MNGQFDPSSWNLNKFGSRSLNLGDLLYLMNGGVCLKIVRPAPPPEYMLQQESHKGRLETSGKMPARNPADKVHYIVRFRELRSKIWKKQAFPRFYHPVNSVPLNPPLSWPHNFPAKEWEIFLLFHESNFHFIREKPSFSQQCLCHLIQ